MFEVCEITVECGKKNDILICMIFILTGFVTVWIDKDLNIVNEKTAIIQKEIKKRISVISKEISLLQGIIYKLYFDRGDI